jgi:hypothetical protein
MAVLNQLEINDACRTFNLGLEDYWLTFDCRAIYMNWVAEPNDISKYIARNQLCVDVLIEDKWIDLQTLDQDITFTDAKTCRYLLLV